MWNRPLYCRTCQNFNLFVCRVSLMAYPRTSILAFHAGIRNMGGSGIV